MPKDSNVTDNNSAPILPVGLYWLTIIAFFPISMIAVLPGYLEQKSLIKKGNYQEARESIKKLSRICYFVLAVLIIAGIILLIQLAAIVNAFLSH